MDQLTLLLSSALAGVSILFIMVGSLQMRQHADVRDRLGRYLEDETTDETADPRDLELRRPFAERVLGPLARQVARLGLWFWPPQRLAALQQRLAMAGNPGNLGAIEFFGLKLLLMFTLGGTALLYGYLVKFPLTPTAMLMLGLMFVCGFGLPDFWLSRRVTQRQQEITNSLPDALDMLTITTEAGMSFESGLQEITTKWNHALALEFARVLRDIGMGQSRREALTGLSERTAVPDVVSFVGALNQAEELGISIGRVLKTQADDMRVRRRQRAHEKANQAPIKMMFPLVFLIFPSIFAVLLGPAAVQVIGLGG